MSDDEQYSRDEDQSFKQESGDDSNIEPMVEERDEDSNFERNVNSERDANFERDVNSERDAVSERDANSEHDEDDYEPPSKQTKQEREPSQPMMDNEDSFRRFEKLLAKTENFSRCLSSGDVFLCKLFGEVKKIREFYWEK